MLMELLLLVLWEPNILLIVIDWIVLGHLFDLIALALLDFNLCVQIGFRITVLEWWNVLLRVWVDLVTGFAEVVLVLWVVRIVMVAIAVE